MTAMWAVRGAATAAFSAVLCAGLIVLLRPALQTLRAGQDRMPVPRIASRRRKAAVLPLLPRPLLRPGLGIFGLGAAIAPPPAYVLAAVVLMALRRRR